MEKTLAQSFSDLYQKVNSDGKLDPFFHRPEAFGVASNDFAAVMLLLERVAPQLPSPATEQVRAAVSVCRQAVNENVPALADDRMEWDLILHLVAALSAGR